jgi:hypothetical protein
MKEKHQASEQKAGHNDAQSGILTMKISDSYNGYIE